MSPMKNECTEYYVGRKSLDTIDLSMADPCISVETHEIHVPHNGARKRTQIVGATLNMPSISMVIKPWSKDPYSGVLWTLV